MGAPINLEVVDTPIVEQTKFGPDMQRWLPNLVDIINASLTTISNAFANLIAVGQTDVGGAGAGPLSVTVTGLAASNYVNVTLISSTDATTISNVTAGSGSFSITFSADPGASAIIVYQAFTTQPQ